MKVKKRWLFGILIMAFILMLAVPAEAAASYNTVNSVKTRYGSYYVWISSNNTFKVQKVGSSKVKAIERPVYTVNGITNGRYLFYTTLEAKFSGRVTLYRYDLKKGKTKKVGVIKNALHIVYGGNGFVYGNGAKDGRSADYVYRYNLKTGKKKVLVKNFFAEYGKGKYLYGIRNGVKYRYNLDTGKMKKSNYSYNF